MNRRPFRTTAIALLLAVGTVAAAAAAPSEPSTFGRNKALSELGNDVNQILAQEKDKQLSNMTVGDVTAILDRISIAQQQYLWVKRSEHASLALPGLGQYLNGDTLNGTLYLSGSVLLFAGTIVGAYFALPSDLHFGSIDYFNDSYSSIHTAWGNHSFVDYLPSIGVIVGGAILQGILRAVSSNAAGDLARKRIKDGSITFQPEPILVMPGAGSEPFQIGVGMNMRY
ncbi:hypothetical protein [Salinispira pacifica]